MTGTEIYKRTPGYEREAAGIRLHAPQWKLLLAFDGQRSLAEVALSAEMPFSEALPLTDKFLGHGWIEEQPITLDQYLKRTGTTTSIGSAVPPAMILHEPKPVASETKPEVSTPPPAPISAPTEKTAPAFKAPAPATGGLRLPPSIVSPPPVPTTAAFPPPVPVPRPRGPLRIKAVVDYIISQVGNTALGQLVVYRIFLRVPPQLLQAEDIASVHLVNDPSVVKTPILQKAIADSVMEVLKRPLPNNL
jgi:hypothetical protein